MEKTITIDGRNVPFKSTGAVPLRYKQQFKRDFFADIMSMESAMNNRDKKNPEILNLDLLNTDILYNLIWVLAKTADNSIESPMEWLDTFETFPLVDIYPKIQELLISSIGGTAPKKQKAIAR
jgi:hypothetical protein